MERARYKKSTDYPQITIRLPEQSDRAEIDRLVKSALKILNAGRTKEERPFTKGPVMVDALKKGLKAMAKTAKK